MGKRFDFELDRRGAVYALGGLLLIAAFTTLRRPAPPWRPLNQATSAAQQPYGTRSGKELREADEAARRQEAARLTDTDLQKMVEKLFVAADPHRDNFHGLFYAGSRAVPYLLKALDDPRTSTMSFTGANVPVIDASPFERICSLLRHLLPPEAAKPLARYLDSPNQRNREEAADVLARIGTTDCIDPVKKALADPDERVRNYALIGLSAGSKRHDTNPAFISAVFPALIPLLNSGKESFGSPAKAMVAMDSARAVPILESPQYFSTHNPQLTQILEALDRKEIKVPARVILPVLAELESPATAHSAQEVPYAAALALYANNPDQHAELKFKSLLNSPSDIVSEAAARGLETLAHMNHSVVFDIYDQRGFAAMTKPQQYCFAVQLYLDEVNNGGHRQYFYNDDSDLYQVATDGMREMGAGAQAAILSEAALAFAPEKPATTESQRRQQMEALGSDMDPKFESADKRFFKLEEAPGQRLSVLLTTYALKHPTHFANSLISDKKSAESN